MPDVKKEIEKMEEEEAEQMQKLSMYQQTMGAVNDENNAGNISGENEGELERTGRRLSTSIR